MNLEYEGTGVQLHILDVMLRFFSNIYFKGYVD